MEKKALESLARQARAALEANAQTCLTALRGPRLPEGAGLLQELLLRDAHTRGDETVLKEGALRVFLQLCGLRYMEANGFLEKSVFLPAAGSALPGILNDHIDTHGDTLDRDGLYTRLFLKTCAQMHEILPDFFPAPGPMDLLCSLHLASGAVPLFRDALPEEAWRQGPQIVGWLYECYRGPERRAASHRRRGGVRTQEVAAATQFFTEPWVVQYLVQNTLGRLWMESHPDSFLSRLMPYFLDAPQHTPRAPVKPESLRFLDPCMGAGHILLYAFDLFLQIYLECGVPPRRAARKILEQNLWGLDIDPISQRLTSFALLMRARACDPSLFASPPKLHLCAVKSAKGISRRAVRYTANGDDGLQGDLNAMLAAYRTAAQTGALTYAPAVDTGALQNRFAEIEADRYPGDFFSMEARRRALEALKPLCLQTEILLQSYDAVVTNPPYLSRMERPLRRYVDAHWPLYNNDLFAVFLARGFDFCKAGGYCGYMTPYVWMFIKSYAPLREWIAEEKSIHSLIQLPYGAFADATVPLCAFVLQNRPEEDPGLYLRLTPFPGGLEEMGGYVREAAKDPHRPWCFEARLSDFRQIPGTPLAYWAGGSTARVFRQGTPLGELAAVSNGLFTCDNRRFLRMWWEVRREDIDFSCANEAQCRQSPHRWFPYNKGGAARKWYGNQEWVVDFADFGADVRACRLQNGQSAAMTGRQHYFQESLSWGFVNSSHFTVRAYPKGFVFDIAGSSLFPPEKDRLYRLGFLNSSTAFGLLQMLNPTLNCQAGDLARLPILEAGDRTKVERLVAENIAYSREDWDCFETSWNFSVHPLVRAEGATLPEAQTAWGKEADLRFARVKRNEEAINAHFAALYGTGAPVSVPESSLSIRKADPRRDAESLVSFFVGVWFGRFSCDFWQPPKGRACLTAAEGASAFADFLTARFGPDAPACLAPLLGAGKPLTAFKRYLTRTFFRTHCRVYRKRPIYWQLKKGVPAFLYLHGDLAAGLREAAALSPEEPALQAAAAHPPAFDKDAGVLENFSKLHDLLRPI